MGFGAEFQDMTDREILIELAGDLKALKECQGCPSECSNRITRLETIVACAAFAIGIIVIVLIAVIEKAI